MKHFFFSFFFQAQFSKKGEIHVAIKHDCTCVMIIKRLLKSNKWLKAVYGNMLIVLTNQLTRKASVHSLSSYPSIKTLILSNWIKLILSASILYVLKM